MRIATMRRYELRTPGIVKIMAKLLDAGARIEITAADRKAKRHVVRLARALGCSYGFPVDRDPRGPLMLGPRC